MRNLRLVLMVALLAVFATGVLSAENPSSEQGKSAPVPSLSTGECKVTPSTTWEITMDDLMPKPLPASCLCATDSDCARYCSPEDVPHCVSCNSCACV
jgi:hypothetical protein